MPPVQSPCRRPLCLHTVTRYVGLRTPLHQNRPMCLVCIEVRHYNTYLFHRRSQVRFGSRLGVNIQLRDTLWAGLTDSHAGCPMGITAENLAADYSISRPASDEYALASQSRWKAAQQAGAFAAEIAPLELKGKKGVEVFGTDEHPRDTTLERMSQLPTTFKKNGVVSAASASGICDGAATLVVASGEAVAKHKLTPLCEVVSWASVGVDPTRMGIGPVPAIRAALCKAGMSLAQMDRVEINEAFAPQVLACAQELHLDMSKLNVRPHAPSPIEMPFCAPGASARGFGRNPAQR